MDAFPDIAGKRSRLLNCPVTGARILPGTVAAGGRGEGPRRKNLKPEIFLAFPVDALMYRGLDALARAYGPWWLCNDVTRPFWQSGRQAGPEREDGMVAIRLRDVLPCIDAHLRGTRLRGRGNRVVDPSSLS